ncbi:uncharacterized protein YndB with AHSA1/START domain [Caulobacter ginsengisoli]|uniref:Uncharacterized protein YndB with AHSA1/START domain n=1 Tax=Caulobacter ginsengisoli TaxID=400775 RepID=A0ABU0IVE0_9CAUL|nr:hypothetical protein [Caulobacter ginsengisoli]MDQ0465983.1 uncharacterized protein YndB with AHSA1/START domain [Caulobacter ginsengisoli]
MSDQIDLEFDLDEPADKVWRAISEPELRERWLGANDNGVDCEVLEAQPDRLLRLGWRETSPQGERIASTVTFVIGANAEGGVRLRIIHDDFMTLAPEPALLANDPPNGQWGMQWAA